jgi:septal ring factor EnvC (AmiA/AmiB activator)
MVPSPTRMFSVIVEPKEGEKGLTQRKVGMYSCSSCGLKFPTVISRQHYLIVGEEQLTQIQNDVKSLKKENEGLQKKLESLMTEHDNLQNLLENTRKEAEVSQLQTKLHELDQQVSYLNKEKEQLEQKVSKLL